VLFDGAHNRPSAGSLGWRVCAYPVIGCNNPVTMVDIASNATRHLLERRELKRPAMPGAGRPTLYRPQYCRLVETLGDTLANRIRLILLSKAPMP
jgi:hypothetical protein